MNAKEMMTTTWECCSPEGDVPGEECGVRGECLDVERLRQYARISHKPVKIPERPRTWCLVWHSGGSNGGLWMLPTDNRETDDGCRDSKTHGDESAAGGCRVELVEKHDHVKMGWR